MTPEPIYYTSNTWNLARGIASSAIDVSESTVNIGEDGPIQLGELYLSVRLVSNLPSEDVQPELINSIESDRYDEASESNDVWPFDDLHHLLELVDENLGIRSENRDLNNLAKEISSMVQEDPRYEYLSEPEDDTEEEQVEEDDTEEEAKYSEHIDSDRIRDNRTGRDDQEEDDTSSETTDLVDSKQTKNDTKSVAEINNNSQESTSESDSVESETDENSEQPVQQDQESTPTVESDSDVKNIAERLYDCFKRQQGDTTYTDITKEYQSPFPDRSVALHFVMNVSRDRNKGVNQIQEWVSDWFGNPKIVKSENENFSRRPMGTKARSD